MDDKFSKAFKTHKERKKKNPNALIAFKRIQKTSLLLTNYEIQAYEVSSRIGVYQTCGNFLLLTKGERAEWWKSVI